MGRRLWMIGLGVVLAVALACVLRAPEEPSAVLDSAALGLLLEEQNGCVYVLAVSDGSPAEEGGLMPGDCILLVGERRLTQASQLSELLKEGEAGLLLTIRRDKTEIKRSLQCR